jgi:hypothetical protein
MARKNGRQVSEAAGALNTLMTRKACRVQGQRLKPRRFWHLRHD